MKLTIEQKPLIATLKRLAGIVENRNTIPILANVAIEASDGRITFRATDLDIEATATIAATVEMEGSCTVGAKMLADIVSKLANGSLVAISCDEGKMTITSGRSRFSLATLPIQDFPVMASAEYASTFTMQSDTLHDLLGVAFCASTEETRYYLQGVYLHPSDGRTVAVATNGHQLAMVSSDTAHDFPGVIIPRKTVGEVSKGFTSDEIEVSISETKIRFATPDFTIVSKVIDGTFPDYTRVIPKNNNNKATFDAADMRSVIDRVTAVSDERSRGVLLSIGVNGINVSARSSTSEGTDGIIADIGGDPQEVGFNGGYLLDVMRQFSGQATLQYGEAGSPALFTRDDGAVFVVMPMRV